MAIVERDGRQRMQRAGLEQRAGDGMLRGDIFPFEFCRQTSAAPAREGVGLEEAKVADGRFGELLERARAVQCEEAPSGSRRRWAVR